MTREDRSRPGQAARGENLIDWEEDHLHLTASPQRPATAKKACPFCGAPALKPNRRERRQNRSDNISWVMQHATWCRTYIGRPAGTAPRPSGGAAW